MYQVIIVETDEATDTYETAFVQNRGVATAVADNRGFLRFAPGQGSGSIVKWYPATKGYVAAAQTVKRHAALGDAPAFVFLAHELIHAYHDLHGDLPKNYDDNDNDGTGTGKDHEEARTIGLGPYADEEICENAIRKEHQLPRRTLFGVRKLNHLKARLNP